MNAAMIIVENASKKFGEFTILNQISMTIQKGEICGLVGRNGSGKTVLMKCICGFLHLTKGNIFIQGKLVGNDESILDDLGLIIETPGFLPGYSGFKNLKLLSMLRNRITDAQIRETILLVGLDPDSKKKVGKYSMGMKQRLGIAQAIMEQPEILILDEPLNGLDQQGVVEIRNLLLKLKENGTTILLASHIKEDMELLCDHIYMIDNGSMKQIK